MVGGRVLGAWRVRSAGTIQVTTVHEGGARQGRRGGGVTRTGSGRAIEYSQNAGTSNSRYKQLRLGLWHGGPKQLS